MEVILMDDVAGLGDVGDTVRVRPGFARNFLIPRGKAVESDTKNARVMEHRMRQVESKRRRMKGTAEEVAQKIRDTSLQFVLRIGSGGRVFGAISAKEIAERMVKEGFEGFDRKRVHLAEPIKKPGTHFIKIHLHPEVQAQLKIEVEGKEASKAEEEQETKEARQNIEARSAEIEEAASEDS